MVYKDSKHLQPLAMGEAYQELVSLFYKRYYGKSLHYFKGFQAQISHGESAEGVEVKLDQDCLFTHRLSIEIAEKKNLSMAEFSRSGIFRTDNTREYAHGNWKHLWVFNKATLQEYYLKNKPDVVSNNPPTIKKFYISITIANSLCKNSFPLSPIVCDKSFENPLPGYKNCLPCNLFVDGECKSNGTKVLQTIEKFMTANRRSY